MGLVWARACPVDPVAIPVKSRGLPRRARTGQSGLARSNPGRAPAGLAIWVIGFLLNLTNLPSLVYLWQTYPNTNSLRSEIWNKISKYFLEVVHKNVRFFSTGINCKYRLTHPLPGHFRFSPDLTGMSGELRVDWSHKVRKMCGHDDDTWTSLFFPLIFSECEMYKSGYWIMIQDQGDDTQRPRGLASEHSTL